MGKKFWANLTLCVVLGGLFVFAATNISSALTAKGLFSRNRHLPPRLQHCYPRCRLVNYNLSEDPNRMVQADFIVKNSSDQDVKNLNMLCEFYDPSGKFLDRKTWLLSGQVPAGKTMQHNSVSERFVNTRAKGLQCTLVDFDACRGSFFRPPSG